MNSFEPRNPFSYAAPCFFALHSNRFSYLSKPVLTCFLLLLIGSGNLFGQNNGTLGLANFEHAFQVNGPSPHTPEIEFQLGTATSPAAHVLGFKITLFLPDLQVAGNDLELDLTRSWIGNASELEVGLACTDSLHGTRIDIYARRKDGMARSAYGTAFELRLIGQSLDLTSAVDGGGLVMVENIDFKQAPEFGNPETSGTAIRVYPNPSTDEVHINLGTAGACEAQLLDAQGQLHVHIHFVNQGRLELREFPRGMYILRVRSAAHHFERRLLLQ